MDTATATPSAMPRMASPSCHGCERSCRAARRASIAGRGIMSSMLHARPLTRPRRPSTVPATHGTFRLAPAERMTAMIPAAFEYHAPASLDDATALLARLGEEAKILSGGQSLIPLMKLRLSSPPHVVDINGIPGLSYIREADGVLAIGALTRESELEESEIVRARYPLLHDTCKVIADPLVRNLATIGGNLAHADPANDHPATMLALGAEVVAEGPNGRRTIGIDDFFQDIFTTALGPNEVLTEIRIPEPRPRSGGTYLKLERKVGDFAIAGVAAQVVLDQSGAVES